MRRHKPQRGDTFLLDELRFLLGHDLRKISDAGKFIDQCLQRSQLLCMQLFVQTGISPAKRDD